MGYRGISALIFLLASACALPNAARAAEFACAAPKQMQPDIQKLERVLETRGQTLRKASVAMGNMLDPAAKQLDDLDENSKILSSGQWSALSLALGMVAGN